MIGEIKRAIRGDDLVVKVYNDEVIFYIWEVKVPIVFERATTKVFLKSEYMEIDTQIDQDMLKEIVEVVEIIRSGIPEMSKW